MKFFHHISRGGGFPSVGCLCESDSLIRARAMTCDCQVHAIFNANLQTGLGLNLRMPRAS